MYAPIFRKDGNELFIMDADYLSAYYRGAQRIALSEMFVEGVFLGMEFVRVQEIDIDNIPHVTATLSGVPVAIISGPIFDERDFEEE